MRHFIRILPCVAFAALTLPACTENSGTFSVKTENDMTLVNINGDKFKITGTGISVMVEQLQTPSGENTGNIVLWESKESEGLGYRLSVKNMSPGSHAFHFHETGKCEGPDFKSAGGHFNPAMSSHGFNVEDGPHAGDMKNIEVGVDGTGVFEGMNMRVSLGGSDMPTLKDGDGSAIIVHAGADDYASQPSGAAGVRIACAVISK